MCGVLGSIHWANMKGKMIKIKEKNDKQQVKMPLALSVLLSVNEC